MSWYKSGTIALESGSVTVTGSGTRFNSGVNSGDVLWVDGIAVGEIATVVSNTELELANGYAGITASGVSYSVQPTVGVAVTLKEAVLAVLSSISGVKETIFKGVFPSGSTTAPGIGFEEDPDTGFMRSGTNQMTGVAGGKRSIIFGANGFERIGIGLPSSEALAALHISGDDVASGRLRVTRDGVSAIFGVTGNNAVIDALGTDGGDGTDGGMLLYTGGRLTVSVTAAGDLGIGTQSSPYSKSNHTGGVFYDGVGKSLNIARQNATPVWINRTGNDGGIIGLQSAGTTQGTISVSGSTVSYNGGHLSRWAQTSDSGILRGSILSSLDEMSRWRFLSYETPTGPQRIEYFGDADDGTEIDISVVETVDDVVVLNTYTASVGTEDNEQLTRVAMSEVAGDKAVTGVFERIDDSDEYGDVVVAMSGDFIIRIQAGATVARGDLIESAGDGTGRAQADDLVRSSTVAKVTSAIPCSTYADGSYTVPCLLMLG